MASELVAQLMKSVENHREMKQKHDKSWYLVIGIAMVVGLIAMAVLSKSSTSSWQMFACCLLLGTAATLVGALAGFTFGIPKTVTSSAGSDKPKSVYTGNTNLEEISDWLTKILVGAGLVELSKVSDALNSFGSSFRGTNPPPGPSLPLGPFGWIVAPALVITYGVCGFLLAYLWARIYLTQDLEGKRLANTLVNQVPNETGDSGTGDSGTGGSGTGSSGTGSSSTGGSGTGGSGTGSSGTGSSSTGSSSTGGSGTGDSGTGGSGSGGSGSGNSSSPT